jgi:hypothetical protein
MTFLKTLGRWIVEGLQVAAGLTPFLQTAAPQVVGTVTKIESELSQLASIIVTVEAVGASLGLPGNDKIRAAGPLVEQLIQQSALMAGQTIADGPKYATACQTIAGGIADLLNSLKAPVAPTPGA